MTDENDPTDDPDDHGDSSTRGTCPACGTPTTMTVLLGPGDAYSTPCGCRVAPESVLETGTDLESPGSDPG